MILILKGDIVDVYHNNYKAKNKQGVDIDYSGWRFVVRNESSSFNRLVEVTIPEANGVALGLNNPDLLKNIIGKTVEFKNSQAKIYSKYIIPEFNDLTIVK